jgi:hypothetical protein
MSNLGDSDQTDQTPSPTSKPSSRTKRRPLTAPEITLQFINAVVCMMYAMSESAVNHQHPFWSAFGMACRMCLCVIGGRWIGNFLPVAGDLGVIVSIGTLVFGTCKKFLLGSA